MNVDAPSSPHSRPRGFCSGRSFYSTLAETSQSARRRVTEASREVVRQAGARSRILGKRGPSLDGRVTGNGSKAEKSATRASN